MDHISPEIIAHFFENNAFTLKPTQTQLSFPVLKRIFTRLKAGKEFAPIQVEKEALIDGHHRFVCLSLLKLTVKTVRITNRVKTIGHWPEVYIDPEDWDTTEQKSIYCIRYD